MAASRRCAVVLVVLLATAACGGGSGDTTTTSAPTTTTAGTTTTVGRRTTTSSSTVPPDTGPLAGLLTAEVADPLLGTGYHAMEYGDESPLLCGLPGHRRDQRRRPPLPRPLRPGAGHHRHRLPTRSCSRLGSTLTTPQGPPRGPWSCTAWGWAGGTRMSPSTRRRSWPTSRPPPTTPSAPPADRPTSASRPRSSTGRAVPTSSPTWPSSPTPTPGTRLTRGRSSAPSSAAWSARPFRTTASCGPGTRASRWRLCRTPWRTSASTRAAGEGIYDDATEEAVRLFQRDYRLAVDGKAGPQTLDLIDDVVSGASEIVMASQDGVGEVLFGTAADTARPALNAIFGRPRRQHRLVLQPLQRSRLARDHLGRLHRHLHRPQRVAAVRRLGGQRSAGPALVALLRRRHPAVVAVGRLRGHGGRLRPGLRGVLVPPRPGVQQRPVREPAVGPAGRRGSHQRFRHRHRGLRQLLRAARGVPVRHARGQSRSAGSGLGGRHRECAPAPAGAGSAASSTRSCCSGR